MANHLMMKEYSFQGLESIITRVVLFNATQISEKQVDNLIRTGMIDFSDDVVVLTKNKYEKLLDKKR